MLVSLLRRARQLLSFDSPLSDAAAPLCVPEWCDAIAEQHAAIWWKVKSHTMTSPERVVALCQSIAYLERRHIPGAIVECGVWKGGSMMAAALVLMALRSTQRRLFLFDTFAGMPEPGDVDVDWEGRPARELLRLPTAEGELYRASCSLDAVKQAMMQTRYPWEKMCFVPGDVLATIPQHAPESIALLRLDTDWHQSTYHELEHLYPRLADGGVLIIDDYGHWQGARKAVDDYFRRIGVAAELNPIDFTGRILIKRSRTAVALAA